MRSSDHVVSVALGGHIMLFLMDVITQTLDFYDKGGGSSQASASQGWEPTAPSCAVQVRQAGRSSVVAGCCIGHAARWSVFKAKLVREGIDCHLREVFVMEGAQGGPLGHSPVFL